MKITNAIREHNADFIVALLFMAHWTQNTKIYNISPALYNFPKKVSDNL